MTTPEEIRAVVKPRGLAPMTQTELNMIAERVAKQRGPEFLGEDPRLRGGAY